MDILDRLNVRKIVNARGPITLAGGSLLSAAAFEAYREAGQSHVLMHDLQEKAGAHVAKLIGVEGAFITSGAAAGLFLCAAACLARDEIDRIRSLPVVGDSRNEIVVQDGPEPNFVYQAMRAAGAKLSKVGTSSALTVNDIERAISKRCVGIQVYLDRPARPSVGDLAALARRHGVRLIVDAAGELPPRENLRKVLRDGADLVVFSGGKAICGPQNTGLIVGPSALIEHCRLNSSPHKSIGRVLKVSKEDLCAFVVALEEFMAGSDSADLDRYFRFAKLVEAELRGLKHVRLRVRCEDDSARPNVPRVYIEKEEQSTHDWVEMAATALLNGEPSILVGQKPTTLMVDVMSLRAEEIAPMCRRIREVLAAT